MKTINYNTTITDLERTTLDQAVRIIHKYISNCSIILYGSRARGEARDDSDYDILVITQEKHPSKVKNDLYDEIYDILIQTDQWVSVFIVPREIWESPVSRGSPFYREICRDGITL